MSDVRGALKSGQSETSPSFPPPCQPPAVSSLWEESGRTGRQRAVASLNTGGFKQRGRNGGGIGGKEIQRGKEEREVEVEVNLGDCP